MRRRQPSFDPRALAQRLRGAASWSDEAAQVGSLVEQDPTIALPIAAALDDDVRRRGYDAAIGGVRSQLLHRVCLVPGSEATSVAVTLGARADPSQPSGLDPPSDRSRRACMVAGLRAPDELAAVLDGTGGPHADDPAFGLDLAQELVVRGERVPMSAEALRRSAQERGDPLAALPTSALAIEVGLRRWLPSFGTRPGSSGTALAASHPEDPVPLDRLLAGLGPAVEVDRARAGAVAEDLEQRSNGRVVVRSHQLGDRFDPDLPPPLLHADRGAEVVTAAGAADRLFSLAVNGGAYSRGAGASHARLCLWRSLAGLLGVPGPIDVEAIARAAEAARWILIALDDEWFDDVAWDLWLVAVAEQRVTMLAVTDTD